MLNVEKDSKIQNSRWFPSMILSLHCYLLINILIISGCSHLWRQWPWSSGLRSCYLPAETKDKAVSFPIHVWRMCLFALGGSREALKQLKSSWFDVVQTHRGCQHLAFGTLTSSSEEMGALLLVWGLLVWGQVCAHCRQHQGSQAVDICRAIDLNSPAAGHN